MSGGCCAGDPPDRLSRADGAVRERLDRRLARLEGQLGGIRRMLAEGRWCADVLQQMAAARASLRSAEAELLGEHLRTCVAAELASGDETARSRALEELVALYRRG